MSIYRSYFSKNDGLISSNRTNNSRNPVIEVSYGTANKELSRFIFDIDLSAIKGKIDEGIINPDDIVRHTLHLRNTIRLSPDLIGGKYSGNIKRASNFALELFNIDEEWEDGTGYEFIYGSNTPKVGVCNWIDNKIGEEWSVPGSYDENNSDIIGVMTFDNGDEDIEIDITEYINQRLTGYGYAYDNESFGLGIKFADQFEDLATTDRMVVSFHAMNTNTTFEPYIETFIDDIITDDRNYFYLDKVNNLYLYSNANIINVNSVTIFDNHGNVHEELNGSDIKKVREGIYKVEYAVDSDDVPDAVIFKDVWNVLVDTGLNEKDIDITNKFYLISEDKYYNVSNHITSPNNYSFSYWGINEKEKIKSGDVRKINIKIKELYPNQDNLLPLDIEYRIFTSIAGKYEDDIIPYTKVDRTNAGYEFTLDTTWMIPQDYKIQLRLKLNGLYFSKETMKFSITPNFNLRDYDALKPVEPEAT